MMPEDVHGDDVGATEHPAKRGTQKGPRDPFGYRVGEIPRDEHGSLRDADGAFATGTAPLGFAWPDACVRLTEAMRRGAPNVIVVACQGALGLPSIVSYLGDRSVDVSRFGVTPCWTGPFISTPPGQHVGDCASAWDEQWRRLAAEGGRG